MEIMGTTNPDGRSSIKPKGQDPERPSDLAFESTEDPYALTGICEKFERAHVYVR
jgi:hypothetical protein